MVPAIGKLLREKRSAVGNGGEAQDGVASDRCPGDGNTCSTGWDTSRCWLVRRDNAGRKLCSEHFRSTVNPCAVDRSLVALRSRNHRIDFPGGLQPVELRGREIP